MGAPLCASSSGLAANPSACACIVMPQLAACTAQGPLFGASVSFTLLLVGMALSSAGVCDIGVDSPSFSDSFIVSRAMWRCGRGVGGRGGRVQVAPAMGLSAACPPAIAWAATAVCAPVATS